MATTSFTDNVTLIPAAWLNDADKAAYAALTGVSGTNTIAATGSAALSAYASGQAFRFVPAATNTGATTINITQSGGSALGAKNIFNNGAACLGGEIKIGVPIQVVYDGTQFHICGGALTGTKIGTFTRDISLATGTQAITGVGFVPRAVDFFATASGQAGAASWGFNGPIADGGQCVYDDYANTANTYNTSANSILIQITPGNYVVASISSYDADGFTVSWTKQGSPTGTATIQYRAYKL